VLPLTVKLRGLQAAEAARDGAWLDGCDGFAVYDEDGRVGTVSHASGATGADEASSSLAVRTGLFHHRILVIAATAIEYVDFGQRRIQCGNPRLAAQVGRRRLPVSK